MPKFEITFIVDFPDDDEIQTDLGSDDPAWVEETLRELANYYIPYSKVTVRDYNK